MRNYSSSVGTELDVRNENPKYTDKSSSQQIGQVTPPTFLLWTDCSVRHNFAYCSL